MMSAPWKPILVTFFIGWFLGAASGFFIMPWVHPMGHPMPHGGRNRFYKELALTPEQRTQADKIIEGNHQRLDQIFEEVNPRIEAVRISTRDDIRRILTPEQLTKYEKIDADFAKHFKKRFELSTGKSSPPRGP